MGNETVSHAYLKTNGITLHVAQAGPQDGPLLILLHGFPEFWYGWRRQIEPLAEEGFRVLAPDQRGYNLSDGPEGIGAYNQDQLSADVVGLIDAAGRERAYLAGHDWGGAVAWWTAMKYPQRLEKMVILNAPHHKVFGHALRTNRQQRRKSRYMAFFQIRRLPETLLGLRNCGPLVRQLVASSRPGTFTEAELDEYRRAWSQPGAMTAMVNWYRAARLVRRPADPRIRVPTLVIWGRQDRFLGAELAQPSVDLCDQGRLVTFDNATHWVQHEEADQVNRLIREFFV